MIRLQTAWAVVWLTVESFYRDKRVTKYTVVLI
jgi:hypothetical protein